MTTLLVFSTGQTDVQLVVDEKRYELDKKTCGLLHDELRSRADEWGLVAAKGRKEGSLDKLPEGKLLLCTPKLDAVFELCTGEWAPTHALVLETRREFASDPRYAGEVVTARMRERGLEHVRRHVYLEGKARLEDMREPQDSVVRREVIKNVAEFLAKSFEEIRPTRVVVATTGGIPNFNALVDELVRLHGVGRFEVRSVEVPDGAQAGSEDRAIDLRFQPAAAYQARWHALSLISRGNLLGAWGAVKHLADPEPDEKDRTPAHGRRPPEEPWVRVVRWLAHFASALPMPPDYDGSLPYLTHEKKAVRAALRVELALRAWDVPRAAQGTVAFLEAAISDHMVAWGVPHPEDRRRFRFLKPPPAELIRIVDEQKIAELGSNRQREENRKRPLVFVEPDGQSGNWYFVDDSEICAIKLCNHLLKATALAELAQKISKNKLRRLRNDAAHEEPTPEMMDKARQEMVEARLWSPGDPPSFLSQALVQDVLRELGVEAPELLWQHLYTEVRARLLRPNPTG